MQRCASIITIAILTALLSPGALRAETGSVQTMVDGSFRMTVDTRWVESGGYRPVRIRFDPVVPQTTGRRLTVDFQASNWWQRSRDGCVAVRQEVIVPASQSAEVVLRIPQTTVWSYFTVRVREGGRERKGLSIANASLLNSSFDWTQSWPAILVVGESRPDLSALAELLGVPLPDPNEVDPFAAVVSTVVAEDGAESDDSEDAEPSVDDGDSTSTSPASAAPTQEHTVPTAIVRAADNLPTQWIDYSCLDFICLSRDTLRHLASRDDGRLSAIRQWARAGGNVLVFGADVAGDEAVRRELEAALFLANRDADAGGWQKPQTEDYTAELHDLRFIDTRYAYMRSQPAQPQAVEIGQPPEDPPFRLRGYGLGSIVATAAADGAQFDRAQWAWLLNTLGSKRWSWSQRHGMTMIGSNQDFWNFLIPGVGLAPVFEFQVLITLFVLIIGPLNYFLLQRRRRLALLILTVPACAGLVTAALFAYGLVSDGLGVRVRPRTYTEIDQASGQAACWSRLSYYAGLAPRDGLRFSHDVVVMPLEEQTDVYGGSRRVPTRYVDWVRQQQHLPMGWLRARTPTQLMTVRSRATPQGLRFSPADDGEGRSRVTNELGTAIRQLLVVDETGRPFWGEAIAADATADIEPIDLRDAIKRLGEIATDHRPQFPDGYLPEQANTAMFGVRPTYWGYGAVRADTSTGRLEEGLAWLRDASRWTSGMGDQPHPDVLRSYVAVVEHSPEVELGIGEAEIEAPLHVIRGTW